MSASDQRVGRKEKANSLKTLCQAHGRSFLRNKETVPSLFKKTEMVQGFHMNVRF